MSTAPAHSDEYNRYAAFLSEVLQPIPLRHWLENRARDDGELIKHAPATTQVWFYLDSFTPKRLEVDVYAPVMTFLRNPLFIGSSSGSFWMLRIGASLFDLPAWLVAFLSGPMRTWQEAADAVEACVAQERMGG